MTVALLESLLRSLRHLEGELHRVINECAVRRDEIGTHLANNNNSNKYHKQVMCVSDAIRRH